MAIYLYIPVGRVLLQKAIEIASASAIQSWMPSASCCAMRSVIRGVTRNASCTSRSASAYCDLGGRDLYTQNDEDSVPVRFDIRE